VKSEKSNNEKTKDRETNRHACGIERGSETKRARVTHTTKRRAKRQQRRQQEQHRQRVENKIKTKRLSRRKIETT